MWVISLLGCSDRSALPGGVISALSLLFLRGTTLRVSYKVTCPLHSLHAERRRPADEQRGELKGIHPIYCVCDN